MRVKSEKHLSQLAQDNALGSRARQQIEQALQQADRKTPTANKKPRTRSSGSAIGGAPSPGEAALHQALVAEFGCWYQGGEVVAELQPLQHRRFRLDFALPRWLCYQEVDGWQHHGQNLDDHHKDRERDMVLASYNWIGFRVSHAQATQNPYQVIEAIHGLMRFRKPLPREALQVQWRQCPKSSYSELLLDYEQLAGAI